jgi:multiple sugar transport system permease protein
MYKTPARRRTVTVARTAVLYLILVTVAFTMLLPLLWMLSTSLKTYSDSMSSALQWIPRGGPQWDNYLEVFRRVNFNRSYFNSVFVAVVVTVGQVATSAMAGYAFSRLYWPGRDKVFLLYLATLMIPVTVTMLPNFVILKHLNWLDSYKALIIPLMFSAYGTFLCRQFMLGLPRSLEESAMIDGCGHFRIFVNVVVPLSTPVLTTLAILTFMGTWQNFVWPLISTFSQDLRVLPVTLNAFQSEIKIEYNLIMAAATMMIVPLIALFVIGQRFFIEGIRLGAIKG